jgi:serine/threonine protein kinase
MLCTSIPPTHVLCRDIKPENVVLEGGKWDGRVYLIDFGGVQGVANAGEPPRNSFAHGQETL